MAISSPFLRQTLRWQLPGGEVAASSCHWEPFVYADMTFLNVADILRERAVALWEDLKPKYAASTQFVGDIVQLLSPAGLVLAGEDHAIAPVDGTDAFADPLPSEVALVASLRSSVLSRSGRGRMYLPAPSESRLTSAGRCDAGDTYDVAVAMQAYLQPFEEGTNMQAVVYSRTIPELFDISSVAVGDVFDAQRRRRNSLTEVRSVRPIP